MNGISVFMNFRLRKNVLLATHVVHGVLIPIQKKIVRLQRKLFYKKQNPVFVGEHFVLGYTSAQKNVPKKRPKKLPLSAMITQKRIKR